MKFYVNQTIQINILRVNNINNSSVLQIGTAGLIKPTVSLANTGGFTEAAPKTATHQGFVIGPPTPTVESIPVPIQTG